MIARGELEPRPRTTSAAEIFERTTGLDPTWTTTRAGGTAYIVIVVDELND